MTRLVYVYCPSIVLINPACNKTRYDMHACKPLHRHADLSAVIHIDLARTVSISVSETSGLVQSSSQVLLGAVRYLRVKSYSPCPCRILLVRLSSTLQVRNNPINLDRFLSAAALVVAFKAALPGCCASSTLLFVRGRHEGGALALLYSFATANLIHRSIISQHTFRAYGLCS
jgi:hypothetical protein